MSDNNKVLKNIFGSGHDLYLDEVYYISYADQREEMTEAEYRKKYSKYLDIVNWPETAYKHKAIAELAPEENPQYIQITGRMIMKWCEEGFIPKFDKYFKQTRRLIMVPVEAIDFYNRESYILNNRK